MLKEKSGFRIAGKVILVLVLFVLAAGISYIIYFGASYYRLPDRLILEVNRKGASSDEYGDFFDKEAGSETSEIKEDVVTTGREYRISTYNIGFGAYTPDFSFFMDGGSQSRAFSRESCEGAVLGAIRTMKGYEPDFLLIQEVDVDATRSYHINQVKMITESLADYNWVYAQNYDSPYVIYPFHQPHGASRAGIITLSKYDILSGYRRSFPVSESFSKFLDLDRCFSVITVPVSNGKYLKIFNLHMSAYGNHDSVRKGQITMLIEEMKNAYEAGDYVICGGDFNHDLSLSEDSEMVASWAYPFPRNELPSFLSFAFDNLTGEEIDALGKSSRDDNAGYVEGVTGEYLLDGFIVSDNIAVTGYEIVDDDYAFSDHEMVVMQFELK